MTIGTVLILNGASSSGKTTLLKCLQQRLPGPYLNAGIDKFIWMLPSRYLDRPLWDEVMGAGEGTRVGPVGRCLFSGMHHAIVALARAGNLVLADHVMVDPVWVRECAQLFQDLPAYFIGVRCRLEELEERERARKDRTLGQARAQHVLVHAHGIYDFEVDTARDPAEVCAEQIVAFLDTGVRPEAFRKLACR